MRGKPTPAGGPILQERGPGEAVAEQEQLDADLEHLRHFLEEGQVEEARRFVTELEHRWPEAERVQQYARVLAPPVSRSRPDIPARSNERELKWRAEHGHEYPGCWVAVYEDRLIDADPDFQVVLMRARAALGDEGAYIFYQPEQHERK